MDRAHVRDEASVSAPTMINAPFQGTVQNPALDELCINTIRTLAIDAVQRANSGHPGMPMALAPVAYTLWQKFLRFNPDDALWANRDRFEGGLAQLDPREAVRRALA
jgi:hypothetical protein